jgi:D-alanyl-D-alanine carboxypeptidase (penicillin-binding protein 5/6)
MNLKRTWKKWILTGLSAGMLASSFIGVSSSVEAAPNAPSVDAESAFVVDFDTMQVLYNHNADEQRGIASMTKMLVEYILFEEIEAGNINWDTEVTISEYAHQVSQDLQLSNVPLENGGTYTIQELYESLAIYSANGSTIAIAEAIEGSEQAFVDRMRELVESWGIEDAQLYNTTGLNNSNLFGQHYPDSPEDAENEMSARDMAIVATHLLRDYPEVLETASIPEMTFRDTIAMTNWNWMLEGLINERAGVDGLKTGTTSYAGATFTGTAEQDGRRLITVVMGAGDGFTNRSQRFEETGTLLDYGFENWRPVNVVEAGQSFEEFGTINVKNGQEDTLAIEAAETLEYLLHEGINEEDVEYVFEVNQDLLDSDGMIEAPIKAGEEIGTLTVSFEGDDLGFLDGSSRNTVSVVASETVERAGFFSVLGTWFRDFWSGIVDRF